MTRRGVRQRSGDGEPRRSDGRVGAAAPAPAVQDGRYVSVEALRVALEAVAWAPVRLAGDRRTRPASPRLPHAVVLHLAADARAALAAPPAPAVLATGPSAYRGLDGIPLDPDLRRLAPLIGTDAEVAAGVVDALVGAGVLLGARGGGVCLSPALLGAPPRCAGVDWRAVALATAGSPSAWVAAHVLAELLEPDVWTPVPRSALERALDCGVSGLRAALDRLVGASVVERREQRGGVSVYRFTPAVLGRGGEGLVPSVPSAPRAQPPAQPPALAASASPRAAAPLQESAGAVVSVGGVELELPPGTRVRVEIGADGRPILRVVASQ